ncbi:MAG: twitching motility protein PilT [Clostridiales bacterium]|nr:twitching motility protein PilT [Clostridiales bacterium]
MVKILAGKEGSGKTKHLLKMANEKVASTTGNIVYLDSDKRHIYDLKHEIRFLNMEEFPIEKPDEFVGFLCGIISNDYDIETIFVDGLYNMVDMNEIDALTCINKLEYIAKKFDIEFRIGMNYTGKEISPEIQKYVFNPED